MIRLPDPRESVAVVAEAAERFGETRTQVGKRRLLKTYGVFLVTVLVGAVWFTGQIRNQISLAVVALLVWFLVRKLGGLQVVRRLLRFDTSEEEAYAKNELILPVLRDHLRRIDELNGSAGAVAEWIRPDRGPLQRIGILSRGDDVYTDDALRLRVAGVDATVTEYRITEERRVDEDRTRTVELFHGFVLSMPAPRAVSGRMSLRPYKGRAFVGKGWFQKSETRLEHPGLHDQLLIEADDPQSVFFVMPPAVQERWVAIRDRWSRRAGFAVRGEELLIAFDGDRNFFELDWRSKASVQECLVRICGELDQVITLADALGAFDHRLARPE